jgi:hypothetical protein
LLCLRLLLLCVPAGSERWASTLSGSYLMLDSRCSNREVDGDGSRLGIGVVSPPAPAPSAHLMMAVGGGGHTREAWEDLASRVFECVLPCQSSGREPWQSLTQQQPSSAPQNRPDVTPHACRADAAQWVVVGAVAPKKASFATPEGCESLAELAQSMLARFGGSFGGIVHLAGGSAGGITALECAARHNVFASATAFFWFPEERRD